MSDATGKTYKVSMSEASIIVTTTDGIADVDVNSSNVGKYLHNNHVVIKKSDKHFNTVGVELK